MTIPGRGPGHPPPHHGGPPLAGGYLHAQAGAPPLPPNGGGWPRPRRGRGILTGVGVGAAILLAAAALVVAVVDGSRDSNPATAQATAPTRTSTQPASTADVDRALCRAIAPLMRESEDIGKDFVKLGDPGTPERDAGIPGFRAAVEDWVHRTEAAARPYASPPRYLTRTLQRYIDDLRLYAANIRPGPATEADAAAWYDASVAYGGPMQVCPTVGVKWW